MSPPGLPAAPTQCTGWGAGLALAIALYYYGFLLAGAFLPALLARPAVGQVPWSFLLGAGLLVASVAVTGIYVLVANAGDARHGQSA